MIFHLEISRLEGVVDGDDDVLVGLVSDVGNGLNVDKLQGWIGRGLDPDEASVGPESQNLSSRRLYSKDEAAEELL